MRLRLLVVGALLCVAARAAAAGDEPPPLVLAVHPFLTKPEIVQRFTPIADFIGHTLGRPVTIRVGGTYAEHVFAVGHDQVDVAFMGPASYVTMLEQFGAKPFLARLEVNHEPSLRGVIAAPAASPLHSIAELRGRRFAFGDPDATMGYFAPAWVLLQAGVPLGALGGYRFVGPYPNVALAVLSGDYDAGAMQRDVFDAYAARGLRILAETPSTPDHVFITRASFAPAAVAKLRAALLSLHETPDGRQILERLQPGLTRLIPGSEADYQELRAMMKSLLRSSR